MSLKFKIILVLSIIVLFLGLNRESNAQIINFDLKNLRKEWGARDFRRANTARFSFYMGRSQKRTMLYMNLARQDGKKFTELIIDPYIERHPNKKDLKMKLKGFGTQMLYPSFRLWLAAVPHAFISGLAGMEGHQGFILE